MDWTNRTATAIASCAITLALGTMTPGAGGQKRYLHEIGHPTDSHNSGNRRNPGQSAGLVEKRGHLRNLPAQFPGHEWRRHWRPERHHQRLDYLKELGVDAIWLTPVYPSPQADFGYDISDYKNIDPQYGTLADFDHLVAEANKRHIRVLMDMVMNHTSDQHEWFLESRSSRNNPYRDWYMWRDGKGETATDKGAAAQ